MAEVKNRPHYRRGEPVPWQALPYQPPECWVGGQQPPVWEPSDSPAPSPTSQRPPNAANVVLPGLRVQLSAPPAKGSQGTRVKESIVYDCFTTGARPRSHGTTRQGERKRERPKRTRTSLKEYLQAPPPRTFPRTMARRGPVSRQSAATTASSYGAGWRAPPIGTPFASTLGSELGSMLQTDPTNQPPTPDPWGTPEEPVTEQPSGALEEHPQLVYLPVSG